MRIPQLSALLVAATLAISPSVTVFADPATSAQASALATGKPLAVPPASSETSEYTAREAKDVSVTKFQGGGEVLVIGGTSLGILLFVLIIVILL